MVSKTNEWEWNEALVNAEIAASGTQVIQVSETKLRQAQFFTEVEVRNNSRQKIKFSINGDPNHYFYLTPNDTRTIKKKGLIYILVTNENATYVISANDIEVFFRKNYMESGA